MYSLQCLFSRRLTARPPLAPRSKQRLAAPTAAKPRSVALAVSTLTAQTLEGVVVLVPVLR